MSVDVTRSLQASADQWMQEREDLATIIRPSLQTSDDECWAVDTLAQAREIADEILTAGWRKASK